jgi:hypothetical protein
MVSLAAVIEKGQQVIEAVKILKVHLCPKRLYH